jgi:hypothetical protein
VLVALTSPLRCDTLPEVFPLNGCRPASTACALASVTRGSVAGRIPIYNYFATANGQSGLSVGNKKACAHFLNLRQPWGSRSEIVSANQRPRLMELLVTLLPIIFRAINLAPQIQEAIQSGTSTVKAVEDNAGNLLPLLAQIGRQMFPGIQDSLAAAAAASSMFDPSSVKWVQTRTQRASCRRSRIRC